MSKYGKTSEATLEALKKGKIFTRAPRGYSYNIINGKRQPFPNKDAIIIKEAFELCDIGMDIAAIKTTLSNQYKIRFSKLTVSRWLRNRFYIGQVPFGKEFVDHPYERLVEKGLFDRVQERLNKKEVGKIKRDVLLPFLYRDLITCETCKRPLRVMRQINIGKIYYKCAKFSRTHPVKRALREDRITSQLMYLFNSLGIDRNIFQDPFKMKIAFHLLFKSAIGTDFGFFEYELKTGINKAKIAAYLNYYSLDSFNEIYEEPIKHDNPILNLCREPQSLDAICQELNLELHDAQMQIFTLQLEDKIEQVENGLWRTK